MIVADHLLDRVQPYDISTYRDSLRAFAEVSDEAFVASMPIEAIVRGRAHFVDGLLRKAWCDHFKDREDVALVAVGGYGRGELHPASDIDILILTAVEVDEIADAVSNFITFLWDIGLEPGHSLRTVAECAQLASEDTTIATNLIESRHLIGAESLFRQMREATAASKIWPSEAFFAAKLAEQERRHRKYDDTAYTLEPNIKENPGGLRDIQMIGWVAKRHFGGDTLQDLVEHHFLTDQEFQGLMAGQSHLWRIRYALHRITGRHEDRLLFEHQRAIAQQFGFSDGAGNLAVEQFMQSYYRTVMRLNRLNEMLLQLFREAILEKNAKPAVAINRRFQMHNGYLEVRDPNLFARAPWTMLEVFLLLTQHPELMGVRANTIRLIREHRHLVDHQLRHDIKARSLFMETLRQPQGITAALRRMNRYGILARLIPAFGNIVGRMQYDLFHVYTVDEHTLRLIRNLRRYSVPELAHEFPLASEVFQALPKPELLYLAGLFHDIAKGRGGDHSELGAVEALNFCRRYDLSEFDSQLVSWLVRQHLRMSVTAQRKDIEDPDVVHEFASNVGSVMRLNYLYLLTLSDIRATNPERWNSWKDSLLRQLYYSTAKLLKRGLEQAQDAESVVAEKQQEALRQMVEQGYNERQVVALWASLTMDYFQQTPVEEIAWQTAAVMRRPSRPGAPPLIEVRSAPDEGCTQVFVCTDDRDSLFAQTSLALSQLGLSVVEARVQTADNGCALNSFLVIDEDTHAPCSASGEQDIVHTLAGALGASATAKDPKPVARVPRKHQQFDDTLRFAFSEDSYHRTRLELSTLDRPGLLALIGQGFENCGVRVMGAKITTLGARAEDNFLLVRRSDDTALTDEDQTCLKRALEELL